MRSSSDTDMKKNNRLKSINYKSELQRESEHGFIKMSGH